MKLLLSVVTGCLLLTNLCPGQNCTPPPSGLISWWSGDTNAFDAMGGNGGTLTGNTTYGPGQVGQAFVFDGNTDGVNIGAATNLHLQNYTIECWIKRASATAASLNGNGNGQIFTVGTGDFGFHIQQADNRLVLGKAGGAEATSSAIVADTNWHHVAVTKMGAVVVFYVDGVAYPAPPYNPGTYTFSTASAYIGAWLNGSLQVDNTFFGMIDELAFYNRDLSATEVQAIYTAGSSGKCLMPGVRLGIHPFLSITGTVGMTFGIQSTTEISQTNSWTTLTNFTLTSPVQEWIDQSVDVTVSPRRFYRVIPLPNQ